VVAVDDNVTVSDLRSTSAPGGKRNRTYSTPEVSSSYRTLVISPAMIVEVKSYGWSWMGGFPDAVARLPDVKSVFPPVVEAEAQEPDVLHPPRKVLGMLEEGQHKGLAQRLAHPTLLELR
jgi:hypothetical protein